MPPVVGARHRTTLSRVTLLAEVKNCLEQIPGIQEVGIFNITEKDSFTAII
jgi:hypothetical protein